MIRKLFVEMFGETSMELFSKGFSFLGDTAWLWVPLILIVIFWNVWVHYIRARFISKMSWVMLEIHLPKEVNRSPAAMELVLNSLQMTFGEAQFIEKYWQGGVRPWTSLELVSIEGAVHFMIYLPKGSRKVFESQVYAQYPDAEVHEVDDYTRSIVYNEDTHSMWGCEFKLTQADPYPIKTYVDYGLDKDPKEEFKIDPMTPALEWLGSIGKGEWAWVQVLVRAHKKEDKIKGKGIFANILQIKDGKFKWFERTDKWKDDVKKELEKIVEDRKIQTETADGPSPFVSLTKAEEAKISALERSITKGAFDVGIRGMYFSEQDNFAPANIGGLIGAWRSYNTNDLNGFKPTNTTGFNYPFQDPTGKRAARNRRFLFDAYRRRSFFHPPYKRKHFVLNTEELATIYHFPGQVAATPTFKRIDSRKSEPPTNLPV